MQNPQKPARFVGALAAIIAAIEGAILLTKRTAQAAVGPVISLPKEVMDLLSAMAQGIGAILERLDEIIEGIRAIPGGGVSGGYPDNSNAITATFVSCPQAQLVAYQLPSIVIPKGRSLDILARNPGGANTGLIWVSGTQTGAQGTQQSRPLLPGATISYRVKNANCIWISAAVAGEGVYLTVEQDGLELF